MGIKVCSGCGACVAICPKKCLSLKMNDEGFLTISDRGDDCIGCGLCEAVCPFLHEVPGKPASRSGYFICEDASLRTSSSSGGACAAITEVVLAKGWHVCGVIYDVSEKMAKHQIARTSREAMQFSGSKYLQSDPTAIYEALVDGDCLVIGTPCQIAGARRFIELKNLKGEHRLVDFYCHGVPSYRLWTRYLDDLGFDQVNEVHFRDKRAYGWEDWTMRITHTVQSGSQKTTEDYVSSFRRDDDFFQTGFLSNACLNKPCYSACPFRGTSSFADIRVGDAWGHDVAGDNMGTSVVLAFGGKGLELLGYLEDKGTLIEEHVEIAASAQMSNGPSLPKCRTRFLSDLCNPSVSQEMMRRRYIWPERRRKLWHARWKRLVKAVERITGRKDGDLHA